MYALALVKSPGLRVSLGGGPVPAQLGAAYAPAGSAVLTVAVVALLMIVVLLGVLARNVLAAVAEIIGPVVRLFAMLVFALLVIVVLATT
jgi:hypothetical protein